MPSSDDDAARLVALGRALEAAAYECGADGRLRLVSAALTALAPAAQVGAAWDELVAPEDAARVRAARAGAGAGQALSLEYRLAGGVPVRDRAVGRAAEGGVALVGALEDLRPRRREALLSAEATRSQALADLASGIAHEVNNALSGIMNYAQLVQRCAPGSAHFSESTEGILSEARRILELNRSLLTFARRSEGAAAVPVGDLARAALAPVRRQLREELVNVELDLPIDVPHVQARGHDLQAVLHYVIEWARRAARRLPPRTRTSLAFRARASLDEERAEVSLVVEHPGVADADELERQRCVELLSAFGGAMVLSPGHATLTLPMA